MAKGRGPRRNHRPSAFGRSSPQRLTDVFASLSGTPESGPAPGEREKGQEKMRDRAQGIGRMVVTAEAASLSADCLGEFGFNVKPKKDPAFVCYASKHRLGVWGYEPVQRAYDSFQGAGTCNKKIAATLGQATLSAYKFTNSRDGYIVNRQVIFDDQLRQQEVLPFLEHVCPPEKHAEFDPDSMKFYVNLGKLQPYDEPGRLRQMMDVFLAEQPTYDIPSYPVQLGYFDIWQRQ